MEDNKDNLKDAYDVSKLKLDFKNLNKINWASRHVLGVAKNIDPEIKKKLLECFNAECKETGMYLTMARLAYIDGYPEIGNVMRQIAYEESEHASRFLELIQGPLSASTEENLESLVKGEAVASLIRYEIASMCKQRAIEEERKTGKHDGEYNKWSVYDFVHDSVHEISRDEARHGKAFLGLLNRYFRNKNSNEKL